MKPFVSTIEEALEVWLEDEKRSIIGEIAILREADAQRFCLYHRRDEGKVKSANDESFRVYHEADDAIEIAKYDQNGHYRPLKTAASLASGWKLYLPLDYALLHQAIEGFYPARLGAFLAFSQKRLITTPLRETLNRQSGMYRVTKRLTTEEGTTLKQTFCRSEVHCMRAILWPIEADLEPDSTTASREEPIESPGQIPLLCQEACNLFIAKAREVVKKG